MTSALRAAYQQSRQPLMAFEASGGAFTNYQRNPLGFFVDVLKIPGRTIRWSLNDGYEGRKWDGTPDPFVKMLDGLVTWRNVGVESGTTTGKTYVGAATLLWFIGSFENSVVVTIAPKEDQLSLHIWKEVGKLWPAFQRAFPNARKDTLRIRMRPGRDDWGAVGFVAGVGAAEESATKAQGFHAEHMLLVYEETPGINGAIMTAFGNTCRAPHNLQLAFGNPDSQLDQLHRFCKGPRTDHIIVSAYDHPNIVTKNPSLIPGAVSEQGIEDALFKAKNNGGADNRMFKSRVRGISPSESAEALIRMEWIKRAQARWSDETDRKILLAVGFGRRGLGVDASNSEDGDHAAIARGKGAVLLEVDAFPCPNSNDLGFKVSLEMKEGSIDDANVGVDGVGVGAGTVNELRGRDRYIRNLIGGAAPEGSLDEEDWNNLRSQMHWTMREDLRLDRIALPPDDEELATDLITPTWKPVNGKICVEKKEEIQKRLPGGRSPNKGDAAVYWNFVRPRDPVVSEKPKVAPTVRERVMAELQALDEKPTQKRYFTLRQ